MAHGRIAVYGSNGLAEEIVRRVQESIAPVMRQQPGFRSYQGIVGGKTIVSYSTWDTQEQAEAASQMLRDRLEEVLGHLVTLNNLYYGEVVDLTDA